MAEHRGLTHSRQSAFKVERDLLCDVLDMEDSDAAGKTAYHLCRKSALIGEFTISEEARKEILQAAEESFASLCSIEKVKACIRMQQVLIRL